MASEERTKPPEDKEIQIPEWEDAAAGKTTTGSKGNARVQQSWRQRFDDTMPPHRKYMRLTRRAFLIVLLAVILSIIALIIGLAAGLTERSKRNQDLPLPSKSATFTGDLTYYGTGLGACGETSGDNDDIVSVSHILFDAAGSTSSDGGNSNENPLCNQILRASRYDEAVGARRSVDLKVVDRCPGCAEDDLDTSIGAFEKLAPTASGRVDVTWAWLQPVQTRM